MELYTDLGKLKWIGADIGWELAIKAVRADLAKRLGLLETLTKGSP